MKNIVCLAILLLLFSSCAIHTNQISADNSNANTHTFNRVAIGNAHAGYFLGIGGFKTDALLLEAKNKLYKNYPLKQNELYGTFTIDVKRGFYLIYSRTELLLSADILMKKGATPDIALQDSLGFNNVNIYLSSLSRTPLNTTLIKKLDAYTYKALVINEDGHIKTNTVFTNNLLLPFQTSTNKKHAYSIDDKVSFSTNFYQGSKVSTGSIVAMGAEQLVVEIDNTNQKIVLYYWELKKE